MHFRTPRPPFTAGPALGAVLVFVATLLPACQGKAPHPPALLSQASPTPVAHSITPTPTAALAIPESFQSWTIQRRFLLALKGRGTDQALTVSSDGMVVLEGSSSGSSRNYEGTRTRTEAQLSKAAVAKLRKALEDPELATQTTGDDSGPWSLTVTIDGKSGTFFSESESFSGAAGRLAEVLASVTLQAPAGSYRKR